MSTHMCACVCVHAHACLLRAPAACSLHSWGGRRGHQKARADDPELFWVTWSGEVGSKVPHAPWI